MIKERLEKLKHLEHKEVYLLVGFIILALVLILIKNIIKNTYAYYNYETDPVPIFTSKVGNFSGKGDTSPLDKPTDVNLLYYVQSGIDLKKYDVYDTPPLDVKSNYVLDEKRSNCIPTDGKYEMDGDKTYSIKEDGTVTVKISQDKPKQVVCRIYYSFNLTPYEEKDGDVKIITYIESDTGDIVTVRNNKYYILGDVPSGYTMSYYECDNKNNITTTVNYDTSKGFTFTTTGKNICHAYFDKTN